MKKLFFTILVFALCLSCSTESENNEVTSSETKKSVRREGGELERLYNTMISSQNYINLKNKSLLFVEKMNYDGDLSVLDNENKLLSWISSNIASTDFVDYNSAVNEFNGLIILANTVTAENQNFFLLYADTDVYDTKSFQPWQETPQPVIDNCIQDCWHEYAYNVTRFCRSLTILCNGAQNAEQVSFYITLINGWIEGAGTRRRQCLTLC